MPKILNLGAGNKLVTGEGAVNHDRVKHRPEIDVVWDLNEMPWPWPDESFDQIIAWAVLEHLDRDLVQSLNECWRILRRGGTLRIKLPFWQAAGAYDDPTHRWFCTLRSLDQFVPSTERGQQYGFYTPCKWEFAKAPRFSNEGKTSICATMRVLK